MVMVQVGEFNGVKNLSLGFSGSYEVEPEQERVQQLLSWSSGLSSSNGLSQLPASQPSRLGAATYQTFFSCSLNLFLSRSPATPRVLNIIKVNKNIARFL